MFSFNKYAAVACLLLFSPILAIANITHWQIIPSQSELTFTAQQNDAPVTGKFTRFTGDIAFDPSRLSESKVTIVVDLNSISAPYPELVDTLKTPPWFNVKLFPEAVFTATQFQKISEKKYTAQGTLKVRDKVQPIKLEFSVLEQNQDQVKIQGNGVIKRLAFGVGQGEWADTSEVKDNVEVKFTVAAQKINP